MTYQITSRQRANARRLGVSIKPSTVKGKKIDVFKGTGKDKKKVASIGALGMMDFDKWKAKEGIEKAKKRQKAFKSRFSKQRVKVGTPAYYADQILW
jgi:hypothetical protein